MKCEQSDRGWEERLTEDHVAVVTLVRDQGVVGDGVEHDTTKLWMFWDWAGHGCNILLFIIFSASSIGSQSVVYFPEKVG